MSASIIGEWYQEYGNLLFDKNIRYYKGNTDVNEGMQRVLKREPENFFYYNNGVKILCSKVERKAKNSTNNHTGLFSLTSVSVVNGAQTTGTIGLMHKSDPEHVAKASVMLQIIDLSSATENMALQITKLSNTQNRIENKDFAALDPQQDRIRAELAFSHISYLYKTGDSITDPDHQITFDEAIVAMACGVGEISYATLAKSNVGALSEDIGKTPYKALFNASTNTFVLVNNVMAIRKIESFLKKQKDVVEGKERLVCIHANRFIAFYVIQKISKNEKYEKQIYQSVELDNAMHSILINIVDEITKKIELLYSDSYPANIFKNVTKCKKIYESLTKE